MLLTLHCFVLATTTCYCSKELWDFT